MTFEHDNYYLGFDLSTQQLKIIVTNDRLEAVKTYNVEFDVAYKQKYHIHKGVRSNLDTGEIVSPVHMWLEAIDHVFGQMKADNFPFAQVRGISGSGMQHGSVFWAKSAQEKLHALESATSLSEALDGAFSWDLSPNWQDHSTGQQAKDFEKVAGGPDELAARTGSRAHQRFTGLQIRKLAVSPELGIYENTDRISIVSSFVASVLLGNITPIDEADACGMNIFDISKGEFDRELLAVAAGVHPELDGASQKTTEAGVSELERKLGGTSPVAYEALGNISPYFVRQYGFSNDAKIYSFTGDNLATIISLPLKQNDVLVSLGTSTTVLLVTENYVPSSQYHLFKHPTMKNAYMGMICYCNGALARENVRNLLNKKYNLDRDSWDKFNELLDKSSKFNNKLGIYFPLGEIAPDAPAQIKRCELKEGKVEEAQTWPIDEDVESIVESQTISCRMRAGPMLASSGKTPEPESQDDELKKLYNDLTSQFGEIYTDGKLQNFSSLTSRPNSLYFVGGASRNRSIILKMGSIMGATNGNYQVEIPNACALGGAYKASWSYECEKEKTWIDFNEYLNSHSEFDDVEKINVDDSWTDYFPAMGMLANMESSLKLA